MISQVTIVTVALLGYAFATNDEGENGGVAGNSSAIGYAAAESGGYKATHNYPPKPYQFHYSAGDEQGHYRNEESDESGTVRGTYGYRDAQGLYRVVHYVADARGFRANITTNEPGTDGKENPASVNIEAEKPPAGIQDRWTKTRGAVGYGRRDVPLPTPPKAIFPRLNIRYPTKPLPPVKKLMPKLKLSKCKTGKNTNLKECLMGVGSG